MELDLGPQLKDITSKPSISEGMSSSSKLGFCEVCACENSKYSCPRCEVKTCSLKCSKIHKAELKCSGERDRTKFIPLNKFSNLDLSSDYRLLEEISKSLELSRKNSHRERISHVLFRLGNAAKSRKTHLKFLPFKFTRRKNNTTHFRSNQIFWHVEWIFANADNLRLYDKNVPETEKPNSILEKYLKVNDESLREKLQYYQAVGLPGVRLLLKAEQKSKKFYDLDGDTTLKECLEKKLIIEYPTIYVVLKDHGFGYSIIDSDDEDDGANEKNKSGNEVVNNILKAERENEKSSRNLLFVSDHSDQEMSENE